MFSLSLVLLRLAYFAKLFTKLTFSYTCSSISFSISLISIPMFIIFSLLLVLSSLFFPLGVLRWMVSLLSWNLFLMQTFKSTSNFTSSYCFDPCFSLPLSDMVSTALPFLAWFPIDKLPVSFWSSCSQIQGAEKTVSLAVRSPCKLGTDTFHFIVSKHLLASLRLWFCWLWSILFRFNVFPKFFVDF